MSEYMSSVLSEYKSPVFSTAVNGLKVAAQKMENLVDGMANEVVHIIPALMKINFVAIASVVLGAIAPWAAILPAIAASVYYAITHREQISTFISQVKENLTKIINSIKPCCSGNDSDWTAPQIELT